MIRILAHHCKRNQSETNIDQFAKILTFYGFVEVLLINDGKKLQVAKNKLEEELNNKLRKIADAPLSRQASKLQEKVTKFKRAVDELKDQKAKFDEEFEAAEDDEDKQEKIESKRQPLETKLADKEKEFDELSDELQTMFGKLEDSIEERFPGICCMFDEVYEGLQSVFGEVMLRKGLNDAKWSLCSMGKLFNESITPFLKASTEVTKSFIGNGDPSDLRLDGNLSLEYKQMLTLHTTNTIADQLMLDNLNDSSA